MTIVRTFFFVATIMTSLVIAPSALAAESPSISSVSVTLPTTSDPAAPPSQRSTQVNVFATYPAGCRTLSEFRYSNEDGVWKTAPIYMQRPYITPSVGYGYKGVYVQLWGSCSDSDQAGPIGNVVYKRYTLVRPTSSTPVVTTPRITSVSVTLPSSSDPAAPPGERLTQVNVRATFPKGCRTSSEFRYANEDGVWKTAPIYMQRPYITPSAGYGYKGVYVQLLGSCGDDRRARPIGNIVYTRYTLVRPAG